MRRRNEQQIDAYRDGALNARERARVERELASDPAAAAHLRRTDALGSLLRDAWGDMPEPTSPEYLIAALRPEMARVDRELASEGWRSRLVAAVRDALRPVPAAALAGACALMLLYLLPADPVPPATSSATSLTTLTPAAAPPTPIYDLAQGEHPLMIFEGEDGATVIWILEDPDEISAVTPPGGWA